MFDGWSDKSLIGFPILMGLFIGALMGFAYGIDWIVGVIW